MKIYNLMDADISLTEGNMEDLRGADYDYVSDRIKTMSDCYIKIHAPWYEGTPEYNSVFSEVFRVLIEDYNRRTK